MTDYALELIEYIENHGNQGRLLAELYADENFAPDWRTRQQQPSGNDSGFEVAEGDDDDH